MAARRHAVNERSSTRRGRGDPASRGRAGRAHGKAVIVNEVAAGRRRCVCSAV